MNSNVNLQKALFGGFNKNFSLQAVKLPAKNEGPPQAIKLPGANVATKNQRNKPASFVNSNYPSTSD